jgi:hypothetical protein
MIWLKTNPKPNDKKKNSTDFGLKKVRSLHFLSYKIPRTDLISEGFPNNPPGVFKKLCACICSREDLQPLKIFIKKGDRYRLKVNIAEHTVNDLQRSLRIIPSRIFHDFFSLITKYIHTKINKHYKSAQYI